MLGGVKMGGRDVLRPEVLRGVHNEWYLARGIPPTIYHNYLNIFLWKKNISIISPTVTAGTPLQFGTCP